MGEHEEIQGGGDSLRNEPLDEPPDVLFRHRTDTTESGEMQQPKHYISQEQLVVKPFLSNLCRSLVA